MQCPMRRSRQQLDSQAALAALERGNFGVLSVAEEDGFPYLLPINYAFAANPAYVESIQRSQTELQAGSSQDASALGSLAACVKERDIYARTNPDIIGSIYIHGAIAGHKVDVINNGVPASFCVVDASDIVPEELTSYYRSVIAQGIIEPVVKPEEKQAALECIGRKYSAEFEDKIQRAIKNQWDRVSVHALRVTSLVGKEARELMEAHRSQLS